VTRIYLIRHGKAAAGWGADRDPGLDDVGRAQAAEAVARLAPRGPLPLVASPLRRTRETAAAFEQRWGAAPRIEPRVAEIPSPTDDLPARAEWLKGVMQGRWSELDDPLQRWRRDVVLALQSIAVETVVISHFIAINAAVGHALGDDRVICFRPDNCSITVLDVAADGLRVVELGAEAATRVL
jgi:broad specificity phosphatase PhoE